MDGTTAPYEAAPTPKTAEDLGLSTKKSPAQNPGARTALSENLDRLLHDGLDIHTSIRDSVLREAEYSARSDYPNDYLSTDFNHEVQNCRSAIARLTRMKEQVQERAAHTCADMKAEIRLLQKKHDSVEKEADVELVRLERALTAERAKHDVLIREEGEE